MQLDEFFAPRVLIVSGKGGVGKTTVSAALALVAARQGRRACITEVDQEESLPRLFGDEPLGYEPRELSPDVWGMNIVPDEALAEYLDVQYHMKRIAKVFSSSHFVDYITATAPGLKDILVLGKIWYLEQGRAEGARFDTIIVDAPAAGHMLQFLSAPHGLSDAVRVGPVRRQAEWLDQMLKDPSRSRVHLVALAEEMPVTETIETAAALDERLDISIGATFANALYPEVLTRSERERLEQMLGPDDFEDLIGAAERHGVRLDGEDVEALLGYGRFIEERRAIQAKHLRKLKREVEQPVVELPHLFGAGLELPGLETLADAIESGIESL